MRSFYIEVDTNDGYYVGCLVTIPNEKFECFKHLIEKIKNFKPSENSEHNFCYGEIFNSLYDTDPQKLYSIDDETFEDFMSTFNLYYIGEYGFTIKKIQEVTLGERIL